MANDPTIGELFEAKTISEADLVAAVYAYIANPETSAFDMSHGLTLDLAAAVAACPHARFVLDDPEANMMRKRGVVRRAILLSTVEAGEDLNQPPIALEHC